jgi:hypothetical protein
VWGNAVIFNKLNFQQSEFKRGNLLGGLHSSSALSKSLGNVEIPVNDSGLLTPLEQITTELLVKTLRSTEAPETVYWMLRYYLESGGNPIITTDRGKTLFLEQDHIEMTISIYVGDAEDVRCVGQFSNKRIFAMDLIEKYDFVWYEDLGSCQRRRFSAEAILLQKKQERSEDDENYQVPVLFFTVGKETVCVVQLANGKYAGTYSLPAIFATQMDKDSVEYKLSSVIDLLNVS